MGVRLVPVSAAAVRNSENRKTGKVHATHASQVSCPPCPFRENGCYAEGGPQGIQTRELNKFAYGMGLTPQDVAVQEAEAIRNLPGDGLPLRIHVVGDCASDEAARTVSDAVRDFQANGGGDAWTYTHAWRDVDRASWGTVSVLASCETPAAAREAMDKGYPVALVVGSVPSRKAFKIDELTVIPCPQEMGKNITCKECRLCFKGGWLLKTKRAIAFIAHGAAQARVRKFLASINGKEV
jgi:hypothetical protein